jgi:creatinine amidohydrolase/Fe(II)-dependent formamide hydrolase-like protein
MMNSRSASSALHYCPGGGTLKILVAPGRRPSLGDQIMKAKFSRMCFPFRLARVLLVSLVVCATQAFAQIYHVKEMNTEQLRALDREKTVVLLPGGILEQHGPYLPSFSDGYMNERLTQEIAHAMVERPGWKVLIFPLIPLGAGGANEIAGKYLFDGTYAVRFSTLRAVFMDWATALGEAGFRWVFVVHLHGAPNHNRALDQASDYFHETYGGRMVSLFGLMPVFGAEGEVRKTLDEKEQQEDGFAVHAGIAETSLLLFLRPDLVSPTHRTAPPLTGRNIDDLVQIAKADHWPGYFGSPRLANAAYGARLWKALSSRFVEFALKTLDGGDLQQIPRYGDLMKTSPANVAIDSAALARDQEVEKKQKEWLRKKGLQ